ncbi:Peptidase A1 domain-containing protein [Aphelenchoides fujianensis]|nr:Peptidase A1 domain-containing protein [Aphelenchoides fujianensis]
MKTATVVVLLFSCVVLSEEFSISGVILKRNAAQLAEYRRQQRASHLFSRDYLRGKLDETLIANIGLYDPQTRSIVQKKVSVETATEWLYLFDASMVNQTQATFINQTFTGKYENYDVSGQLYWAQMAYRDLSTLSTVVNQTFAIVGTYYNPDNTPEFPFDGVLGLGWRTDASDCDPTLQVIPPVRNILSTTQGQKPYYVLHVNATSPSTENHAFTISFGQDIAECDNTFGYTPLVYAPAADNGFLTFSLDGFAYGDQQLTPGGDSAVLDAGSPLITATYPALSQIFNLIPHAYNYTLGIYTTSCDVTALQNLIFSIGSYQYCVGPANYVADIGIGDGSCALMIDLTPVDFPFSHWVIGQPFLEGHCVYYDLAANKIGFTNKHTHNIKPL